MGGKKLRVVGKGKTNHSNILKEVEKQSLLGARPTQVFFGKAFAGGILP